MPHFPDHAFIGLLHTYGAAAIFLIIMLESIGMPLPGESLLVGTAIYAATTHRLAITTLVPAAAAGAICGDQIGFLIGRAIGFAALRRFGPWLHLTEERLELGRFLFQRYGGRIVFFGRFVAFLRTFAALLAGANQMPWRRFLLWNALGGICWTSFYGFGAYLLGDAAKRVSGPIGLALAVVGATALIGGLVYVKRNETRLIRHIRAAAGPA
jgi:membrane protein DedA with SNARE-associated domain